MPTTIKEAIVNTDLTVTINDVPIPTPADNEVLIKVVVSGSNPKDWKYPVLSKTSHNSGDDIAGTVHSVGKKVVSFKPGDRVAAFHRMVTPAGSFAEYAIAPENTTFHLPESVSFEAASTIPLAALTATIGLFQDLDVPEPWDLARRKKEPFLVYGASSATGAFAAQLARLAGLGPIIGIAGAGKVAQDVSDVVIDYRDGEDKTVEGVLKALKEAGVEKVARVFDGISEKGSHEIIARVIDPKGGKVSHLLPLANYVKSGSDFKYPDGVTAIVTMVARAHKDLEDFAAVWVAFYTRALADGRFKTHPHEVIPGGLGGLEKGLKALRDGKASGVKFVYRIEETPQIEKGVL